MIEEKYFQNSTNNEINICISGSVKNIPIINIFFTWRLYLDKDERVQTILEVSFRQWNGQAICYKFEGIKRMRSDEWVKKFVKSNIADLKNKKLKAIRKQGDYYVPTILYALGDV
jgi:hypothetical protein